MSTDTDEQRQNMTQADGGAQEPLAVPSPRLVLGIPAAVFIIVGIVCGILTYWWTALPLVGVGFVFLLWLWWALRHREETDRQVRSRMKAQNAWYRAHPVLSVTVLAITCFIIGAGKMMMTGTAHGWWALLWGGLAALFAVGVGLWRVRRARRDGTARG
ncbi:MAG: hypothetical protein JOY82_18565 [Streptosporangiaceae bacterium]|nr:hypothetical protein [Streptosporangiaceae bacterium]MBV9856487.1 hypothetical protein [Streptosporangiaceae bacterium]